MRHPLIARQDMLQVSRCRDRQRISFRRSGRSCENCAGAVLDDRPLNQIRMLHHEVHDLIVREVAVTELHVL